MSTWVVGDVHGCADELRDLLAAVGPAEGDRVVAVGDLFHRGPDAVGVMEALRAADARFVLGNHEDAILRRTGLAPDRADGSDRPPLRTEFPPLALDDLAGDGRRPLAAPVERLADILVFLQEHAGFCLCSEGVEGAGTTPDGRRFWMVHAGFPRAGDPLDAPVKTFLYPGRVGRRGPLWFEVHPGPDLVLFGHMPADEPRPTFVEGRLVALGLDTGCVYGGRLTAYCPERDEFASVPARRAYARMR